MIYHIYANQSNAGDWLSARGIQSLLAPRRVQEYFCDGPFVPATLAALSEAGPEDFIVIGGGGLFMDYFTPFWEGFRPIAARVPFAIWGAGACDLKLEPSRPPVELIREIAELSKLCVVRDELTKEMLSGCNVPPPIICPAVVAVPTTPSNAKVLLHADHYNSVGAANFDRMTAVARDFARRTHRTLKHTNNLISRGDRGQLQRVVDLYVSADLVLSSRLHGCIISLAAGRRVLAVSGDHKVEAFMRAAGLSDWVLDLAHLASLPERLEKLPEQRLPVEFIEAGRRQNRAVAAEIISMLAEEKSSVVA